MTDEELQAMLAEIRERFHHERMVTSQRAKWRADYPGAELNTCRFCGKHWRKWAGSKLDGHAKCIVGEDFKRWLGELAGDPMITYSLIGEACGVTISVAQSWISPKAGR